MDRELASRYIRENFEASDRLAVVLVDVKRRTATQRIASAERIASPDFQAWLRHRNAGGEEIYLSINTLRPEAKGRTKADLAAVRHIYLDFDEDGTAAVERLLTRQDIPQPNYRVSSSPGRWQVVWKVEGFDARQAERLQRHLARETSADPAATDAARVMRLPGFYNHKRETPHFVSVETLHDKIHRPEDFPVPDRTESYAFQQNRDSHRPGKSSQSERDWAFAKRALARGESPETVTAAIAASRTGDKANPRYYAELTVRKAGASLQAEHYQAGPDQGPTR